MKFSISNLPQYVINPTDIYSFQYADIPDDYEVVAFKPPKVGEIYIAEVGKILAAFESYPANKPRLILQNKKKKVIKFTFLRMDIDCKKGEFYRMVHDGSIVSGSRKTYTLLFTPCEIYSMEEVEE